VTKQPSSPSFASSASSSRIPLRKGWELSHVLFAAVAGFGLTFAFAAPAHAQVLHGAATAVGDGEVFVGEPGNLIEPGVVYVYRPGSGAWEEVQQLRASDATDNDGFGRAVAVDGNLLVVGADSAGSAYVFRKQGSGWVEIARLAAAGDAGGFGRAVAVSGDFVLIGAPDGNEGRGAAHVFARAGDSFSRVATLGGDGTAPQTGPDGATVERPEAFGAAVAIDGEWALIGAPGADTDLFLGTMFGNLPAAGGAYLFRRAAGGWTRSDKLTPPGGGQGAMFGTAVALHGAEAVIGAEAVDEFTGASFVYRRGAEEGNWSPAARLAAFDARPRSNFGAAVAFDGDELLVGAPGAGTGRLEGRVYRFVRSGGEWSNSSKLGTFGLKFGSAYGSSVAIRGDVAVAGLPGDDFGAGSAVIMTRLDGGWDRTRVISEARGLPAVTGGEVPCSDGKAGIFPCRNVDLVSFLPVSDMGGSRGVTTNDLWGWTDPESGREYVILGMRDGTAFIDVTDPLQPTFIGKLAKTAASPASLWRDVKVYGDHAFIVADSSGAHGVQVFALERLREFQGEPITFSETAHYGGVNSSHNLNINEESAFAFAVGNSSGGETCGGALHMFNVEDPRNPAFAGCFQPPGPGGRAVGTHDTQCVTYRGPDSRYQGREICFSSNGQAFSIGDVTDKREPMPLALATYPNLAYTHQGWLDEEQRYFYMNDEGDEAAGLVPGTRTLIWNVEDLEDPILVGEYITDNPATDHNLYIVGDVMYQSNYRSGLRVVDISDRENPVEIGYFDTVPLGPEDGMGDIVSGSIGSWSNYPFFRSGVVAVASGKEGLFIVRLRR